MFGPVLQGERISLEPPRPEDSAARIRWFADHIVARYYTSPGVPLQGADVASADRAARDESLVLWRIALDGRSIGTSFLLGIDYVSRHAMSSMMIGERSMWGHGYATEVVRLRTAFAFNELGLERLESSSFAANVGMHRALERSGYRPIAHRTRQYFVDGRWHDEIVFELLRRDWLSSQSSSLVRNRSMSSGSTPAQRT